MVDPKKELQIMHDKYDALRESHDHVVVALEVFIDTLKERGLIESLPQMEAVLLKAKNLN